MNNNKIITALIVLLTTSQALCGALTWLSPPSIDIGLEGDDYDVDPIISGNGNYVAFYSTSSNLVEGDTHAGEDVFIKNLQTGTLSLVNTNESGEQVDTVFFSNPTADGKYLAFASSDEALPHSSTGSGYLLYIKNIQTGAVHTPLFNSEGISADERFIYLSNNGRYVYFTTEVDLLANDTNGSHDVYIYDRSDGSFELISIGSDGNAAGSSELTSISNNERYINFKSYGDVLPSTTGLSGLYGYIRDVDFGTTVLYTVDEFGLPASSGVELQVSDVSNNGVVYFCSDNEAIIASDNNGLNDFFTYNLGTVSLFPFPNVSGGISDYGCNYSQSKVIVNNDDTKFYFKHQSNQIDTTITDDDNLKVIFVNLTTQQSTVINQIDNEVFVVSTELTGSNNLNDVVFTSGSTIIIADIDSTKFKAVHYNIQDNEFGIVSVAAFSPEYQNDQVTYSTMSDDQNWIAYATTADNVIDNSIKEHSRDLYLLNRSNSEITRIGYSVFYGIDISPNGRYVTFTSSFTQGGTPLLLGSNHLFLYDRIGQSYIQIANEGRYAKVNDDGNVVFESTDPTLVPNDNNNENDVFIFIKDGSEIQRISVNTTGGDANNESENPDIAGSGVSTWIVFDSGASDLIASDINRRTDTFMVNWPNGQITRLSELSGVGGDSTSYRPRISTDTSTVSFLTYASNLVGEDTDEPQVMAYDRNLNSLTVISKDHLGNLSDEGTDVAIPSPTGRYIAFNTEAALVSNDTTIGYVGRDVYVYDQVNSQMTRMTQYENGDSYIDNSLLSDFSVDNSQSPPLIGALFSHRSYLINDYFNLSINASANKQLFLMQTGGDGAQVQVDITGSGTVTGDSGLNCSDNCSQSYVLGQTITLIATPIAGSAFSHWQGDSCNNSTELTCVVHINSNKSIQAIFNNVSNIIFSNGFEN